MISKINRWPVIILFLIIFMFLIMLVGGILMVIYRIEVRNDRAIVKIRYVDQVDMLTKLISHDFEHVVSDLLILSGWNKRSSI